MKRVSSLILIALSALVSTACGVPKPIKYYALQSPPISIPPNYSYPIDLVVDRVAGSDLLAATPIIYKNGPNQIGTYTYHRWADPPLEMVREKLINLLRKSGEYQSVTAANRSNGDLTVRGRLYDFAEVDNEGISGLVCMEFELYDRKTAKTLWRHFYSQTESVQAKEVPAIVQALDRNLERGLNEVVVGLSRYFAAHPPATN